MTILNPNSPAEADLIVNQADDFYMVFTMAVSGGSVVDLTDDTFTCVVTDRLDADKTVLATVDVATLVPSAGTFYVRIPTATTAALTGFKTVNGGQRDVNCGYYDIYRTHDGFRKMVMYGKIILRRGAGA